MEKKKYLGIFVPEVNLGSLGVIITILGAALRFNNQFETVKRDVAEVQKVVSEDRIRIDHQSELTAETTRNLAVVSQRLVDHIERNKNP